MVLPEAGLRNRISINQQNTQKLVFIEYFDESTCTKHVDIEYRYVNLLKFSSNFVHVKPYLLPYERIILML